MPDPRIDAPERPAVDAGYLAALVERARGGDEEAWDAIYRLAYPRMIAYARRRLEPEAARDAVNEAITRAVAAIDRFQWIGAGFDAWLFSILRHVVLGAQRQRYRPDRLPAVGVPAPVPQPEDGLVAEEEARAVRAAFAQLRPIEREVLELRVIAGLSAEETAVLLGKRAGAVRMAQARALDRLRRLLGEDQW